MGKSWLYIEPYVMINKNTNKILLTNTLEGSNFIYNNDQVLDNLLNKLLDVKNNYCIQINHSDFNNSSIMGFISFLRTHYLADYINQENNRKKPFIIYPLLNLQDEVGRFSNDKNPLEEKVISYLSELFLYINSSNQGNVFSPYRQYPCPINIDNGNSRLTSNEIGKVIEQLRYSTVSVINVFDDYLFEIEKKERDKIIGLFDSLSMKKMYHFDAKKIIKFIDKINILNSPKNELNIHLFVKEDFNFLTELIYLLDNINANYRFTFSVTEEVDYHSAMEVINQSQLNNYEIKPLFNGKNHSFFKRNIFLSEREILNGTIYKKDIFIHKKLNNNDFGRLYVFGNGDIFANVNNPKVGNITEDSLKGVICKEMMTEDNWRKTRNYFPCSNCLYQFICPSPTNYEKVMNTNLCINGPF